MSVLRAKRCKASSSRTGRPCQRLAILGGDVCPYHGGAAPQVQQAAARRVTLAEALANGDRRSPAEVLDDALRVVDVAGQQLVDAIARGAQVVTPDAVTALVETAKQQAALARLVLDTSGGDPESWYGRDTVRRYGDVIANVCREFARQLGHDPGGTDVAEAFDAALNLVVYRRRVARQLAARPVHSGLNGSTVAYSGPEGQRPVLQNRTLGPEEDL